MRSISLAIFVFASVSSLSFAVKAQDFFSELFGGFAVRPPDERPMYPPRYEFSPAPPVRAPRPRVVSGEQTWCVRTCDGRYFPISGPDKGAMCGNFCPASKTELVYGSDIDDATTESGKPYSELPNAFRYRTEIVAGCTCNGKDQIGLAPIRIENDPTLRKGDIVAARSGLSVVGRSVERHGAAVSLVPLSRSDRARLKNVPVVAAE